MRVWDYETMRILSIKRDRERGGEVILPIPCASVLCDGAYVLGTAIGVTLRTPRPCNSADRHARRTPGCLIDCLHTPRAPVPRIQTAFCMNVRSVYAGSLPVSMILKTSRTHRRRKGPRRHWNPESQSCDERETARDWDEMGLRGNNVEIAIGGVDSIKDI